MRYIGITTQIVAAILLGCLSALYLGPRPLKDVAGDLVTMLGFLIAALIPAMVLSATSLRASNLSVVSIRDLRAALERQIRVFGGLFLISMATGIILVAGKALARVEMSAWIEQVWVFTSTALLVLLASRLVVLVSGILSLLALSGRLAEGEAVARDAKRKESEAEVLADYKMPPSYGTEIDLGRGPAGR